MFYPSLIGASLASTAQAGAAEVTARSAERKATSAEQKIELIQYDIERLLMITESLWMLLKKEHGYTDDELTRRISQIDMRDGKLDGRLAPSPAQPCPYCGKVLTKKRPFCMYCGKSVPLAPFAR